MLTAQEIDQKTIHLGASDPLNTAAPAYAHGAGNATTLLSPTTTTQTEQMQSLSSRRSRGSKWWPKIDLLATLRPSDPMKTAVPSHAHEPVNAATLLGPTTTMPTEHGEGTRRGPITGQTRNTGQYWAILGDTGHTGRYCRYCGAASRAPGCACRPPKPPEQSSNSGAEGG